MPKPKNNQDVSTKVFKHSVTSATPLFHIHCSCGYSGVAAAECPNCKASTKIVEEFPNEETK